MIPGTEHIAVVSADRLGEIASLRRLEFMRSQSFTLVDESVDWSAGDDDAVVLAAFDAFDRAIASMRAHIFSSMAEAEAVLAAPFAHADLTFPAIGLSRAATLREYQSAGLNSALRFYFLHFARTWGIRYVLGAVYVGSPRVNLMREVGYELTPTSDPQSYAVLHRPNSHRSAVLDLNEHGDDALRVLAQRCQTTLSMFPFVGPYPKPLPSRR